MKPNETMNTTSTASLQGMECSDESAVALSERPTMSESATVLSCSAESFSESGKCQELPTNARIHQVIVNGGHLNKDRARSLGSLLQHNDITHFTLARTRVADDDSARVLGQGLQQQCGLQHLTLCNNNLTATQFQYLCEAIAHHPTLTHLTVDIEHLLGNDGIVMLCDALQSNRSITFLQLYNIPPSDKGKKAIATLIRQNTRLRQVRLTRLSLGDEGAKLVAASLDHNTTLSSLVLDHNEISGKGAAHIAKSLRNNTTLKHLSLAFNSIGNDGAKALSEALKNDSTLESLSLEANNISSNGITAIAAVLPRNTHLKELNLNGNNVSREDRRVICNALAFNVSLVKVSTKCSSKRRRADALETTLEGHLQRNEATKNVLQQQTNLAAGVWADVIVKYGSKQQQPDQLYYLLRQKPDLFQSV